MRQAASVPIALTERASLECDERGPMKSFNDTSAPAQAERSDGAAAVTMAAAKKEACAGKRARGGRHLWIRLLIASIFCGAIAALAGGLYWAMDVEAKDVEYAGAVPGWWYLLWSSAMAATCVIWACWPAPLSSDEVISIRCGVCGQARRAVKGS